MIQEHTLKKEKMEDHLLWAIQDKSNLPNLWAKSLFFYLNMVNMDGPHSLVCYWYDFRKALWWSRSNVFTRCLELPFKPGIRTTNAMSTHWKSMSLRSWLKHSAEELSGFSAGQDRRWNRWRPVSGSQRSIFVRFHGLPGPQTSILLEKYGDSWNSKHISVTSSSFWRRIWSRRLMAVMVNDSNDERYWVRSYAQDMLLYSNQFCPLRTEKRSFLCFLQVIVDLYKTNHINAFFI